MSEYLLSLMERIASPDYAPELGICEENSNRMLARVVGENTEANAKLIAAAPDLLAALESLFKECTMIHSRYGEFCNQKEADAAIKAGLDAIAKAKGE